jgi:hypothetical protein
MGDRIFSEDGAVEMGKIVYMGEEALSNLLQVLSSYTHWLTGRTSMNVDEFMWEMGI